MTTRTWRTLLGGVFIAFGLGLLFLLSGVLDGDRFRGILLPLPVLVLGAVVTCVVGLFIMLGEQVAPVDVRLSWPHGSSPAPPPDAAHPYRGTLPAPQAPRASARTTALVLSACLVFTAAAVPFALHLPRWIEIEVVLIGWWFVWAAILTVVARRGAQLADDHELVVRLPWSRTGDPSASIPALHSAPRSRWTWIFDLLWCASELEAIVFALVLAIFLSVALFGAWLVIEIIAPGLFALAYLGLVRALRRARDYRGSTVRAGLAGAAWASAYVAPLAVVVWLVHVMARHR